MATRSPAELTETEMPELSSLTTHSISQTICLKMMKINKYLKMNFTINNLLDHKHFEIIGGPSLGRVMMIRLETKF